MLSGFAREWGRGRWGALRVHLLSLVFKLSQRWQLLFSLDGV